MTSSCPSTWLKEGSFSPLPTDTTRRRPSEAGGEGRTLRGVGAANGTLVAFAGRTPCAGVNLESLSWAEEAGVDAAAAVAAWCAAALARDLACAAGPRRRGRRSAPDAGASC